MNDAAISFVTPAASAAGGNPTINMERTPMARHTTMPPRNQKTPHGDVTLTSKWDRDHYMLQASGSLEALKWMFPKMGQPEWNYSAYRHAFKPAPQHVTIERELRRVCAKWQEHWDQRLQDHEDRVDGGAVQQAGGQVVRTMSQLINAYLAARVGELAPRTVERNRHYLNRWIEALGGDLDIHLIDNPRLVAGRQKLNGRLSPGTINITFAVLRTCFNWANDRGILHQDPTKGIKPLRDAGGTREKVWWTTAEVGQALKCARQVDRDLAGKAGTVGNTAELLVALGCLLGLRYEEIVMLRWEDVDLEGVNATTGQSEPVCRVRPHSGWSPKDGEARAIPIQSDLAALLRRYLKASGYILEPKSAKPRHGGQKHTYRYDPQRIWNRITKKVEEAGGKRISPHGMRHSFASNLLMAGVSDVLVSRWLGHANTAMVHQHYGHLLAYHGDINKLTIT
jgi:integrase